VKPGVMTAVLLIMAGLFSLDSFLARLERTETLNEARSLAEKGRRLLADGNAEAAVIPLQRSNALVRDNSSYELSLANALLESGKLDAAGEHLRRLLEKDSNDGSTNLAMARLQEKRKNPGEAIAFYHRAIYGRWADANQAQTVRRELVHFLAAQEDRSQLLSELLLLQDGTKQTPQQQLQMAHLFLLAGSPSRAAEMYRQSIRQEPDNADAYAGLADTQLASGDFPAATSSLYQAKRRRPEDPSIEKKLALATELSNLDPTPRRLSSKEKYARSARVLEMVQQDLAQCSGTPAAVPFAQRPKATTNEESEELLTTAENLWKTRVTTCGSPQNPDSPLPALIHKIQQ